MNISEQLTALLAKLDTGFQALTALLTSKTEKPKEGENAGATAGAAPGPDQAKLTELQGLFTTLKGELKTIHDAHATNLTKLTEAQGTITTLQGQITAKDGEITKLKDDARTVADHCAAQGIDISKVPVGQGSADPKAAVLKQYATLLAEDPAKAGAFWEKNQKAIDEAMATL